MTLTTMEAESGITSGGKLIEIFLETEETAGELKEVAGDEDEEEPGERMDDIVYDFFNPSGSTMRTRST